MEQLVDELLQGNRRALARLISMVENSDEGKYDILQRLYPHTGRAYVIGITGPPGAGKSSLVDKLIKLMRRDGLTVGVIAVDPTSPFTGGAILGDRIRMQEHALDPGVFIRSMGTRGSLGGLSLTTREAIQVMDAFGKDVVLVETVGVGQSEVDIVKTADTTVVMLTPAGGDSIQTMKAGIMEIANIFVVNKADLPGAERVSTEIRAMLEMKGGCDWVVPVKATVSTRNEGIEELWEALEAHRRYLNDSGLLLKVRLERIKRELAEQVEFLVKAKVWAQIKAKSSIDSLIEEIAQRRQDPYSAARALLQKIGFPLLED